MKNDEEFLLKHTFYLKKISNTLQSKNQKLNATDKHNATLDLISKKELVDMFLELTYNYNSVLSYAAELQKNAIDKDE